MCYRRFRHTRNHSMVLDAYEYGYKGWPIRCNKSGCIQQKAKNTPRSV